MLRRFSVFSLSLLLCLSLFPARALADVGSSSVLWSGSINDGAQFGAFVKGGTRFDAAAAALGYDSSRLSDEVKAKLSDSSYGGMFYVFANAFSSVSSPIEIPSWVPAFVTTGSVIADFWNNISGSNYPHWSVAVTQSVYDLALSDFLAVLAGGDAEGGGGSSSAGGYIEVYANANQAYDPTIFIYDGKGGTFNDGVVVPDGSTFKFSSSSRSSYYVSRARVYLSGSSISLINSYIEQGYRASVFTGGQVGVYLSRELETRYDSSHRFYYLYGGTGGLFVRFFVDNYRDSDGVFAVLPSITSSDFVSMGPSSTFAYFSDVITSPLDVPVVPPDGVWPEVETPSAPVEPDLPEPAEPVVETPVTPTVPAPVWPDITINIDNDPIPGTTPEGLDYTELLTRINDNLISIDAFARAINSNLNSLRGDLLAEFNGVFDSLRNIYNYLLTIDSVLETHCTHLRNKMEESAVFIANYMRTLIKWLAEQLDYDDLTNVEAPDNSLLTTINEKLGGGTYEPNPIKDEQGYYEWLDDLWDRFLLGDNWQSSMGSISGSFSELKTRFPFSVPWDIVALFRLFVHDPVTPVFDLPLYFSSDGSTPVHVDLSPWDSVASLVRPMIFVIFALKLALLSRDLLGGLGADKGGL